MPGIPAIFPSVFAYLKSFYRLSVSWGAVRKKRPRGAGSERRHFFVDDEDEEEEEEDDDSNISDIYFYISEKITLLPLAESRSLHR